MPWSMCSTPASRRMTITDSSSRRKKPVSTALKLIFSSASSVTATMTTTAASVVLTPEASELTYTPMPMAMLAGRKIACPM